MNSRFEAEPFGAPSFPAGEFEEEEEVRRARGRNVAARRSTGSHRAAALRRPVVKYRPPASKRPRPPYKVPRPLPPVTWQPGPNAAGSGNPPSEERPPEGSEYVRWVQTALNTILNLNLPVEGVMNVETRSAIRSFQRRGRLPVTGIVGPDTERALLVETRGSTSDATTSSQPASSAPMDQEIPWLPSILPGLFATPIEDRTAFAPKDLRKGLPRDINKVYALVLHQTAFSRGNDTTKYDRIPVHFVITPNGKIIQLHPLTALLWSSNGFNTGSVAVEFVGNFRSIEGRYYKPEKFGCHTPTPDQIKAGRDLITHLRKQMPLTHVLAHRQSSGNRTNDPGPEVWFNVGQWAIDNSGLKDGGHGFFINTGKPIPEQWRKWGQVVASYPVSAPSQKQCRVYRGK